LSPSKKHPLATVILTERAISDLREIERYSVKQWGRKTADKYLDDITWALDRLRENPGILRLEPDLAPGLFFYRVRKHVLVCDVEGQTVTVLTVVHTSMDIPTRLAELEPRLIAEAEILHEKLRKKSKPG
jgi:toxin ParE1/3/4